MVVIDVPKGLCMAIAIDGRGQRLAAGSAIQPAPVQMKPQLPPPGSILDAEHCAVITQSGDTWKLSFDGKTLCECKAPATGTFALRFATFQTTGVSGADLIELRVE
jgi:hypothetical protein